MVIHPCKIVSHLTAGLRTAASFRFSSLTYFPSCDALLKWLWAFLVSGVEGKLRWGLMYIMFSGLLSCGLQSMHFCFWLPGIFIFDCEFAILYFFSPGDSSVAKGTIPTEPAFFLLASCPVKSLSGMFVGRFSKKQKIL